MAEESRKNPTTDHEDVGVDAGVAVGIAVLLRALGARDLLTLDHSRRVSRLAARLAEKAGMSLAEQETVRRGALLHDVGKIGVADSILLKPARLTPEEQRAMEEHVSIGLYLLGPSPDLHDTAEIVLHHHERYNGQGYPAGLKAEEIPLGARIVAIVDVYDALTHARPYRKALSPETACAEIRRGSGSMYDPDLARTFLALTKDSTLFPG